MRKCILPIVFFLITACSCGKRVPSADLSAGPHFQQVPAQHSGLEFANNILENDTLNYYTFPYLYMGGGVSIGDINNDGFSDVFVTGNMVSNKLYLNQGDMRFEDISESAGIGGDERWYTGVTMADVNQDGWLDIYLCVSGKHKPFQNQLFINNQNNTFSEQAKSYGLADSSTSIQATFFDYDQDGLLDLFVANYPQVPVSRGNAYYYEKMQTNSLAESAHLYKNNGDNTFSDVTHQAGVQNFGLTLGLVATDFNQDGLTDLYLSNDFNVPDYLYLNNGDGTFREAIQEASRHTSMFGMGADAADINNDGLMDISQVDMTPADHKRAKTNMASMRPAAFWEAVDMGLHYQYMQNSLQLNRGINPQNVPIFSDISRLTGMATTDWSWGVQIMDLDNDGWQDVFITNGMKRDVNNNDANSKFSQGSFFNEFKPDFTLLPSEPISNYAFHNEGGYRFSNISTDWGLDTKGFSNGFSSGDLDNDGDLDLVINNLDGQMLLLRNESGDQHHFLRVQCQGPKGNPFGLGTKVQIQAQGTHQFLELTLTRGFQSSVAPILHFGLGKFKIIDTLTVIWPDGRQQTLADISADQLLTVEYTNAKEVLQPPIIAPIFQNLTQAAGISFTHTEDPFNDFAREPLLPHKNSGLGPPLTVGDVNGDGLDDFFIGNATGHPASLYVQNAAGTFQILPGPWEADSLFEDTGALLFDADNDGDLDLYVANGGNDPTQPATFYQDRLYLNTGSEFVKSTQALPVFTTSGMAVAANDFDQDGDTDLFIGGRIVPGKYPLPAASFLLRNEGGKDHELRFKDVTDQYAPALAEAGLVTAACWEDYDADGVSDLIISGEWMPVRIFKNRKSSLEEITDEIPGLENMEGWWYSLAAGDWDQDGDTDFIAGNLGLNYKYQASPTSPFEIFVNDFDENSRLDIVLSYHKKGQLLPVRGRECSAEQIPALANRFQTFEAFADADLPELYGQNMLASALNLQAKTFASVWLENKEEAGFESHPLPGPAQFSSVNAIASFAFNDDPYPDLMLFGNLYASEVETPRNDAGIGLVMTGDPEGGFTPVSAAESGVLLTGDIKAIAPIQWSAENKKGFLIARNNASLQLLIMTE